MRHRRHTGFSSSHFTRRCLRASAKPLPDPLVDTIAMRYLLASQAACMGILVPCAASWSLADLISASVCYVRYVGHSAMPRCDLSPLSRQPAMPNTPFLPCSHHDQGSFNRFHSWGEHGKLLVYTYAADGRAKGKPCVECRCCCIVNHRKVLPSEEREMALQ